MTPHRVVTVRPLVPGVRALALVPADGSRPRPYAPGSSLLLHAGGRASAYSLTGSGVDPGAYEVSVLRRAGDGVSAALHALRPGDEVGAEPPRCTFAPVATARRHLLVAGGIGITPLLSHVRAAAVWGRDVRLLYGARPGRAAHLPELRALCGPRLSEHADRAGLLAALEEALADAPLGTHLYACGPEGLLDAVRGRAAALGWPAARVHVEEFAARAAPPPRPFEVRLRGGTRLAVPAGTTLLEALERAGRPVPSLCRQGVCGQCRVAVLAGRPDHRDLHLSDAERAAGDALMACVSRSAGDVLELDL